jgi:hypothetical protein
MSVSLCNGDSPFTGFSPLLTTIFYPLFTTTIYAGPSVRVKKSPLLIPTEPFFSLYVNSSEKYGVIVQEPWTVL